MKLMETGSSAVMLQNGALNLSVVLNMGEKQGLCCVPLNECFVALLFVVL